MLSTRDKHVMIELIDKYGADAKDKFKIYVELNKMIDDKPFDFSNTSISGSLTILDRPLAGKYEYYVPDFSKMSIPQAKTSESQTIDFDVMIEFCNWEAYRSYTGEYWFETTIFQPYKKIFVSYSRRQISDENGYNFKTLKELIDYVDSWF